MERKDYLLLKKMNIPEIANESYNMTVKCVKERNETDIEISIEVAHDCETLDDEGYFISLGLIRIAKALNNIANKK